VEGTRRVRKDSVLGVGVKLVFKITQDRRNRELLEKFMSFFTAGKVYQQSPSVKVLDFMISGLADLTRYVIPFFLVHPLEGAKKKDYEDFSRVAELMKSKARARGPCKTQGLAHLNKEGLEQIRLIKSGMNHP
jgi:hypothetical protein